MNHLEKALEEWELARSAVQNLPINAPLLIQVDAFRQLEHAQHQVTDQAMKLLGSTVRRALSWTSATFLAKQIHT
jgi:hypothetical protein